MSGGPLWEVVGGADKGGIIVREGQDLKSPQTAERLATGSVVEELDLFGERLHYKLETGTGPAEGWVSVQVSGKELLRKAKAKAVEPAAAPAEAPPAAAIDSEGSKDEPVLVCWYSGGFLPKDGTALMAPLVEAAKAAGIKDTLVLHFPDAYGMIGEGREPWAKYVDKLVEEIDAEPARRDRPLLLLGHSRGASPALCVATRLGERVKKLYIVACATMVLGQATGWEKLSLDFKRGGDRDLLKWFSSLQPGNILLKRTAYDVGDEEFRETVQASKFFSDMLNIMRTQYRDAMYPDPERDFKVVSADIMAVSPLLDGGSQPEHLEGWKLLTSGAFQLETVNAGHMDCLTPTGNPKKGEKRECQLFDVVIKDMASFLR